MTLTKKQELRLWVIKTFTYGNSYIAAIHPDIEEKIQERYKKVSHLSDRQIDALLKMPVLTKDIDAQLRLIDFVLKEPVE